MILATRGTDGILGGFHTCADDKFNLVSEASCFSLAPCQAVLPSAI